LVAVPIMNGPSFDAETRGNPLERHFYDLNRSFPGEANGTITQRVAATYFDEIVRRSDAVVSLHGGGNVFYLDGFVIAHSTSGSSLDLIKAWGWRRFTDNPDVGIHPHEGTMHEKAADANVPSITVEMGGGSHRSPQHLRRAKTEFGRGLRNVMVHFGMLDGEPDRPSVLWKIRKQNSRVRDGGVIDLEEGIDIDVQVAKGQRLMTVYDALGAAVEEVTAPFAGRIMGLPASPMAYPGRIVASVYEVVDEIPV
jgi:predicted deacylase